MKIIHTSDWHLGARLHEEDRSGEQQAFLEWLLRLMEDEKPDALVVAGDVFDVKAPSPAAQRLYYGFLAKVVKSGTCGKVVVVAGNHDNAGLLAAPASLLGELDISVVARAQGGEAVSKEVVEVKGADGATHLVIAAVPFMYEAELAGFEIDERVWESAEAYWLRMQNEDGSWGYRASSLNPAGYASGYGTGSMTSAGIAALAICSGVREAARAKVEGERVLCCQEVEDDAAIRISRGLNWLGKHFSVQVLERAKRPCGQYLRIDVVCAPFPVERALAASRLEA